jgi:hypothetical protein
MFSFSGFGPGSLLELLTGSLVLVEFEVEVQQSIIVVVIYPT